MCNLQTLTIQSTQMFKRFFVSLTTFLACSTLAVHSFAQQTEVGINVFASQYIGDLRESLQSRNGIGDFVGYGTNLIRPAFGAHLRRNINTKLSFTGEINWGRVAGADSLANETANKVRNLSFRSDILEFGTHAEYNLFPFGWSHNRLYTQHFTPYLFGGIGLFRYNPKAFYNRRWEALQPLSTEGQDLIEYPNRKRYALTQFNIPLGAGLKFVLNQNFNLAFEVGYRYTFTDYLDDVSSTYVSNDVLVANKPLGAALADRRRERNPLIPLAADGVARGNPDDNDAYLFFGFKLSYVIYKNNCPKFNR